MALLEARVKERAPVNVAEYPISTAYQQDERGDWVWVVDIHIHIPRVTEYEVTASDATFAGAIRKAYLGLNNEANLRRWADGSNRAFGVEP